MRVLFLLLVSLTFAIQARAADLTVTVRTPDGHPVEGAAVLFRGAAAAPAGSIRFPWPYRIAQQNIQFTPRLLIVPVGATVSFQNLDPVRHHVYSFSTGNRFELRLFSHDEARTATFNTVGIAALGCNIHDQMSAYVIVVDTPHAAITDAAGQVTLHGAQGAGQLRVWRQDVRAPGGQVSQPLTLPASGVANADVVVPLRPIAAMRAH